MNLSKWINLIKKDLKEEVRILLNDPSVIVQVFLEEIFKDLGINIDNVSHFEKILDIIRGNIYQIVVLVIAEKEDGVLSMVKEIKKHFSSIKVLIILNYLKEEDIGKYFEEGADEVIFRPFTLNEFKARLNKLFKEYYLDKKLQKTIVEDPLTGVYNRRFFEETLQEEVYKSLRQHYPLSLIMIDLDKFKWYNDNLGHQAGDRLLKKLGEILLSSVRDRVDKICRYGGDEFVIILPHTTWKEATIVAERICKNWEKADFKPTTLSIGIAQLIEKDNFEKSLSDLMKRADKAMYQAKEETRALQKNSWKVDEETFKQFSDEAPPDEVELSQS
jgi:diguanylate cyclase (GGDEF)-like protein